MITNCFVTDAEAPDVFLGHAYNYTEERYLRILDKDDFSLIVGGRYECNSIFYPTFVLNH